MTSGGRLAMVSSSFTLESLGGSKRDGDILVSKEALGLDGSHGVLLDDVVSEALEDPSAR